jgi:hypothetical protein
MGEAPVAMLMIRPFNILDLRLPQENRLPEGQGSSLAVIVTLSVLQRAPSRRQANADAVARYAGLCYFKCRTTNAVAIANADLVIRKSLNSEVFSELAEDEVTTCENARSQ